jgi:hypothetical protein
MDSTPICSTDMLLVREMQPVGLRFSMVGGY